MFNMLRIKIVATVIFVKLLKKELPNDPSCQIREYEICSERLHGNTRARKFSQRVFVQRFSGWLLLTVF